MTDPYDLAQKHLRDTLATEYVKSHPETPKEKVGTTDDTGKQVFAYIGEAFSEIKERKPAEKEAERDEGLNRVLVLNSDQRYQNCVASLNTSKRIIHDLFKSKYSDFSASERDRHLARLRKEDGWCEKATLLQHRAQSNFLKMMDRSKRDRKSVV